MKLKLFVIHDNNPISTVVRCLLERHPNLPNCRLITMQIHNARLRESFSMSVLTV